MTESMVAKINYSCKEDLELILMMASFIEVIDNYGVMRLADSPQLKYSEKLFIDLKKRIKELLIN